MPLQIPHSREKYIKVTRVFVDSEESDGTISDYRFSMPEEIQDVVAIEMTAFAVPSSLTPTFLPGLNDQLDFELAAGALTRTFSVTWPSFSYVYQNIDVPYLSYSNALRSLMETAVFTDPDFGNGAPNQTDFEFLVSPEELTVLKVSGPGVTGLRFLFGTGPGRNTSAAKAMGFPEDVDTAALLLQKSPNPVVLDPFKRVDVTIDEFPELQPLQVIYNTNSTYYGTTYNETNVTRTEFLTKPPRRISHLTIRVRIDGKPVLNDPRNHHSFTFTVLSLANEVSVPNWAKNQFFSV